MTQIRWTLGGNLSNHETFYFDAAGGLVVEKDHHYLVDATPQERDEIYRLAPYLKSPPNGEGVIKP